MQVIPCPHESGAVANHKQRAPDHHPLTKEEIAVLLDEAKTSNSSLASQIQIRLCQGIPGYVCPRVINGPVSDKECEINKLYVENFRRGADLEIVDQYRSPLIR